MGCKVTLSRRTAAVEEVVEEIITIRDITVEPEAVEVVVGIMAVTMAQAHRTRMAAWVEVQAPLFMPAQPTTGSRL